MLAASFSNIYFYTACKMFRTDYQNKILTRKIFLIFIVLFVQKCSLFTELHFELNKTLVAGQFFLYNKSGFTTIRKLKVNNKSSLCSGRVSRSYLELLVNHDQRACHNSYCSTIVG